MKKPTGYFVISLDFELLYGLSDQPNQRKQRERVVGGRLAAEKILKLFSQHNIHATWAMVGMLMARNKEELQHFLPTQHPAYDVFNHDLSTVGENETDDPLHYACNLMQKICDTPNQEIGSHTFSHYFCLAEGQDAADFEHDLLAAIAIADEHGLKINSFVFPKNQTNYKYLSILSKYGIKNYRGNESSWIYSEKVKKESMVRRAIRLLDSYINLSGMNCYNIDSLECKNGLVNIPSSRFLRPYMIKLKWFEKAKIRRIMKQMKHAAKHGKIFHLWWHPHNFGENTKENMENLNKLVLYYEKLNKKYRFQSATMGEVGEMAI